MGEINEKREAIMWGSLLVPEIALDGLHHAGNIARNVFGYDWHPFADWGIMGDAIQKHIGNSTESTAIVLFTFWIADLINNRTGNKLSKTQLLAGAMGAGILANILIESIMSNRSELVGDLSVGIITSAVTAGILYYSDVSSFEPTLRVYKNWLKMSSQYKD